MGFNLSKLIALFISMILLAIHSGSIWPVHEKPMQIWSRTWIGPGWDDARDVVVDGDDIYVVGENQANFHSIIKNALLIKYDADGNQLWNTTWNGLGSTSGEGIAVDDGYVYITGRTYIPESSEGGAFVVKYDGDGNQVWNRTWIGPGFEIGTDVSVYDGYIYMTGYTTSFGEGEDDALLVKYDGDGNQLWNTTWGGPDDDYSRGVAADGGKIYMTGWTASFGVGDRDAFIVKYDVDGNKVWNRTWGGSDNDIGSGIAMDGGDIYIVGNTASFKAEDSEAFIVKYDVDGNQVWNRTWGGPDGDGGSGVAVDGGYIYIVGYAYSGSTYSRGGEESDVFLAKFDVDGNQIWYTTWGGPDWDYGYGVAVGDGIYIAGITNNIFFSNWYGDAFLVRYTIDLRGFPPSLRGRRGKPPSHLHLW